jgi:hypothetical protein
MKSSFKKLLLSTGLWQHAEMSTNLKSPDGLKDAECKKGQLSNRPPILYLPVTDIITPKEDPQVYKVKLPDDFHINMQINFHGTTKNTLPTLLHSSPSSSRGGWTQGVGSSRGLF